MTDKRFIEVSFPIKEISAESVKEKTVRRGHVSTLHIWWARRPLASSRATAYASLIAAPTDADEWTSKRKFIVDLSKWENSLSQVLIETARQDILEANGSRVRVLDPFAGGGSIPLEALRLGCETYAGDYNPVAFLILKATLEYPQKYGARGEANEGVSLRERVRAPLAKDLNRWRTWVLQEAKKEVGRFYPLEEDGRTSVGYMWARTIPCQNPSCSADIPLMRQFWLAKKEDKKIALRPQVGSGRVEFEIVRNPDFDPSKGTVNRAVARCLICGSTVDGKTIGHLFSEGRSAERLVVVPSHAAKLGKSYRIAAKRDIEAFLDAENYLEKKRRDLAEKWGIDPIPDEETPEGKGRGAERAFSIRNYGLNKWGDLFNSRQKLLLITLVEKVRLAHEKMLVEGYPEEYSKVIATYLAFIISRFTDFENKSVRWALAREMFTNMFARQAIPMVWDYVEANPFSEFTNILESMFRQSARAIDHLERVGSDTAKVYQGSATSLPFQDEYFDAIFTDPPYYDNVPYSYLSDFFYVWLKRAIGELYPEVFSTPLTPKSNEIVAYTKSKTWEEAKELFESNLRKSFQEIWRVLKPKGIVTIVYAHKSTAGWEALINSLLDSGLVVTASWPVHTEMKARMRARESAALASSIYIVARRLEKSDVGWYNEVRNEIGRYVNDKLAALWKEGISGADYFIAAIGSAIEIFGKYEKVMDYEGNVVRADRLVDFVREVVTDYIVRQLLHNGIAGELSPLTKFYLLWRWTFQDRVIHFDDARKLAQSTGIDLASQWDKGFIRKEKEFIRVLGPHERVIKDLRQSSELVDVLHHVLILWKEGRREDMGKLLNESGWGNTDAFYRIAQATSETLPPESKEKKLLDGFLSGKEKIMDDAKKAKVQTKLFE